MATYRHPLLISLVINCLLISYRTTGQELLDTNLWLGEIEVTADRLDFTDIGKHTDDLDTSRVDRMKDHTLASMLSMQTPLYIRTYGNGTLATVGIRGGNASHTQVIWNGIPMRNPMVGLVDLALIPSWMFDEASVHYGGHGAAFGSGAVGGLISIGNHPLTTRNGAVVQLVMGSWKDRAAQLQLKYGFKRVRLSTRLFSRSAENNYRYKLSQVLGERNQTNHELQDRGVLQEINWTLSDKESLTSRIWFQHTDREIPPTSTQTTSKSAQQDQGLRVSLQWLRTGEKIKWQIKSALLDEAIDYQDSLILLYTHNRFRTWLTEVESSFALAPHLDFAGGAYTEHVKAESDNYFSVNTRNQHAVYASVRYARPSWLWRFQVREELTDDKLSPLLLDFSAEWIGWKGLIWKGSISRNYRVPTLNDLYWRPGGNPDLEPEQGWTLESGLHFRSGRQTRLLKGSVTAYSRSMEQWIMWMPPIKDVRNYWSPVNVAKINSRGLEMRADTRWQFQKWVIQVSSGLDLTWSTFEAALPEFGIQPGDQLFYVPIENLMAGINLQFSNWSGYYQHHYYGDSPGINEEVKAGDVAATGFAYTWDRPSFSFSLSFQVENLWNVPYRIIERRPMPGRSYKLGLRLAI